jgi:branched-subunit amino acid transport protein
MTGIALLALAGGVLLPKVLPALVMPDRVPSAVERALGYLGPALLAALAVGLVRGVLVTDGRPAGAAAFVLAGLTAALLRRDFVAMVVGWLVLVAEASAVAGW